MAESVYFLMGDIPSSVFYGPSVLQCLRASGLYDLRALVYQGFSASRPQDFSVSGPQGFGFFLDAIYHDD